MGKFFKGVVKFSVAAAAVGGLCYFDCACWNSIGFLRPNYIRNPEHHCGRRVCSNLFQDGNHEKKRGKRGRKRA